MKSECFAIVLSVLITGIVCKQQFIIRDCAGDKESIISLISGSVNPDPVAIPGVLGVTGSATVNFDFNRGNLDLDVHIERYVGFLWVTVPCISDVGSCRYDACDVLHKAFNASGCPAELKANSIPCTCDTVTAGKYSLNDQKFKIPELSGLYSWLASGDYKVDLKLLDSTTKDELACLHLEGTIVDGNACSGFLCSIFG